MKAIKMNKCCTSIKAESLKLMNSLYVYLSKNIETANKVGKRHGAPVIFKVCSSQMS